VVRFAFLLQRLNWAFLRLLKAEKGWFWFVWVELGSERLGILKKNPETLRGGLTAVT